MQERSLGKTLTALAWLATPRPTAVDRRRHPHLVAGVTSAGIQIELHADATTTSLPWACCYDFVAVAVCGAGWYVLDDELRAHMFVAGHRRTLGRTARRTGASVGPRRGRVRPRVAT